MAVRRLQDSRLPRRPRTDPRPRPGGQGGGRFPAQQRPKGDPELIQRGRGLFAGACGPCHGADARGGQLGGPNLLRSELALNDKAGELMYPVIKNGRPGTTMVPTALPDADIRAVIAFVHDLQRQDRRPGRSSSRLGSRTRHRRRRRQGWRGVFHRPMRHLPLGQRRPEGHRDPRGSAQGPPEPLGVWRTRNRAWRWCRPPGRRTTRRDDGHGHAPVG